MKSIINDSDPKTSCSTDSIGKTSISEFMNLPNELESINYTFHMTNRLHYGKHSPLRDNSIFFIGLSSL